MVLRRKLLSLILMLVMICTVFTGCGRTVANVWLVDSIAPTSKTKGNNGDMYLNTSNYDLYQMQDGKWLKLGNIAGKDGVTPTIEISEDGYWIINGKKTTTRAVGRDGRDGKDGKDGKDGISPLISISEDGYWVINGKKTAVLAKAQNGRDGKDGKDGQDGLTPTVEFSEDGYWVINGVKTKIKAKGEDGKTPTIAISEDGYWVINGVKTKIKAECKNCVLTKEGTYLNAVENVIEEANFNPTECSISNGNLLCDGKDGVLEVKTTVEVPKSGTITFEDGYTKDVTLNYETQTVVKDNKGNLVVQDENYLAGAILKNNEAKSDSDINFRQISSNTNGKGLYYTKTNTKNNQTTYYFRGAVDNNYVKFGTEKTCNYKGVKVIYLKGIDPEDGMPMLDIRPSKETCSNTTVVCDVGTYIKDTYGDNYRYVIGDESFAATLGGNAAVCSMFGGTIINEKATYSEVDVYWKIVRINEDGSTRLIYQGNEPSVDSHEATIGESAFNEVSNDNAHVGYMYGKVGSTTYEATHKNTNDSTIKKMLDNWYSKNLTSYSNYIADAGFCNDRSITAAGGATKLGYGTNYTNYKAWERMYSYKPQFVCPQKNDLFTVNNGTGNQALTYPIGLITIDEAAYAGGVGWTTSGDKPNNFDFYLNNGTWYWTMTPNDYADFSSYEPYERYTSGHWYVHGDGHLYGNWSWYDTGDVRPVINLKSNVEITKGNGTVTNPYVVKTN